MCFDLELVLTALSLEVATPMRPDVSLHAVDAETMSISMYVVSPCAVPVIVWLYPHVALNAESLLIRPVDGCRPVPHASLRTMHCYDAYMESGS